MKAAREEAELGSLNDTPWIEAAKSCEKELWWNGRAEQQAGGRSAQLHLLTRQAFFLVLLDKRFLI